MLVNIYIRIFAMDLTYTINLFMITYNIVVVRLYLEFWTNVHTSISPQMDMDRHVSTNVHAVTC